jgi:predicted phosphodiesterase
MFAVLSDIHGNRAALEAVLEEVGKLGIRRIVVLGDVVGYGPFPSDCLRLLAGAELLLQGNHEAGVLGELDEEWFNDVAWAGIVWTRANLSALEREPLMTWPKSAKIDGIQFAHGSLNPDDPFDYLDSPESLESHFGAQTDPLCFVGHTHVPAIWTEGREAPETWPKSGVHTMEPGLKTVINVGSVGFCRSEDPRPSWVTYDPLKGEVALRRTDYDVDTTVQAIRRSGHEKHVVKRLLKDLGRRR